MDTMLTPSKIGTKIRCIITCCVRGNVDEDVDEANARNFGKDLKKFEDERKLPFTSCRMNGGKMGRVFTRRKVFDWLIENDYTEHVLNEEGEENGGIPMPVEDGFTYGSY